MFFFKQASVTSFNHTRLDLTSRWFRDGRVSRCFVPLKVIANRLLLLSLFLTATLESLGAGNYNG